MVDLEFEDMIENHDSVPGDADVDDPPLLETKEPKSCCRCALKLNIDEEVFDCDGCVHSVCVFCRFKDNIQCMVCKPQSETSSNPMPLQTASLKELYSRFFKKRNINKDHIVDVELSTEEGNVQKQMCTVCKRIFKKSNSRYHYACATGEKPYICCECGQQFVKKSHLDSHLNRHFGLRPHKCLEPKCKASFTQKDKLIRHIKSHNKDTKFMCSLCDKLYSSQDILKHHMVKVHSSTKQFKCDQCPRSYKYPSSLRIHRLKHQAKRDYMCEVCGKKYALSSHLKVHKKSHVLYHRRPFKCRCGRRFMSHRDKARHELIHNSCQDFECSLCNTTFGRKDNLERHMKNFHQEDPPILSKHRKLVATVAPFNSKPTDAKKCNVKINSNYVVKQKTPKTNTPRGGVKHGNKNSKENINKPAKIITNPNQDSKVYKISNKDDKQVSQKQSVIVFPKPHVSQNRPSVIKSIPNLLPYRILPPDKRFLKMTEDINQGKGSLQVPINLSIKTNCSSAQNTTFENKNDTSTLNRYRDSENSTNVKGRIADIATTSQNVKRRIPKDDALNRCFRIIHHTGPVEYVSKQDIPRKNIKRQDDLKAVTNKTFDDKVNSCRFSGKQQTRLFPSTGFVPSGAAGNNVHQEIKQRISSEITSRVQPLDTINRNSDLCVGGPSLSASLADSVPEMNQEDHVTNSYASMGETSYGSYTPYFDNEYFRDSMNNYYSSVENLIPNDFDMGFHYIGEQLGCSEINFSNESKVIKYVSQENKIVRKTFTSL